MHYHYPLGLYALEPYSVWSIYLEVVMEELALAVDAVADVVVDVVVANNKSKLTNPKPLIHGQFFGDR